MHGVLATPNQVKLFKPKPTAADRQAMLAAAEGKGRGVPIAGSGASEEQIVPPEKVLAASLAHAARVMPPNLSVHSSQVDATGGDEHALPEWRAEEIRRKKEHTLRKASDADPESAKAKRAQKKVEEQELKKQHSLELLQTLETPKSAAGNSDMSAAGIRL